MFLKFIFLGKNPLTDEFVFFFFFFLLKPHKIIVKNPKRQKLVEKTGDVGNGQNCWQTVNIKMSDVTTLENLNVCRKTRLWEEMISPTKSQKGSGIVGTRPFPEKNFNWQFWLFLGGRKELEIGNWFEESPRSC